MIPQQDYQADSAFLIRLMMEGNLALAAKEAEVLAEKHPDVIQILVLAAQAQLLVGKVARAQEIADQAIALDSEQTSVLVIKSRIALALQDRVKALKFIEAAIFLEPESSGLHQEKGDIHATSGQTNEAKAAYLLALKMDERNATAFLNYSLLEDSEIPASLVKKYIFFLSSQQLSPEKQAHAHFALSNFYKAKGELSLFTRHLFQGNDIFRKKYAFDSENAKEETSRIINYFSREFFTRTKIDSKTSDTRIIFIVGMPRSGSTLVEQILSKHSKVMPTGESGLLTNAIGQLSLDLLTRSPFPEILEEVGDQAYVRILDFYLDGIASIDSSQHITDKTLINYKFIGLIYLLFPAAKIIHVKRSPAATCYSCYRHLFAPSCVTYSYSLEHLASVYREYLSLMRHWRQTLPGAIHEVQYEELVENPEEISRRLLEHCGLRWESQCLDFHDSDRTIFTASNISVKQPLYSSAIDSWKAFSDHLGPVLELEE